MYALLRPLLFGLDPEKAHGLALKALQTGLIRSGQLPKLETHVLGFSVPNPLGLAAGFDKDAEALDGAFALGFGFVEVGTVTPKPQPGNPKPRLFRDAQSRAIINRMGFPGKGAAYVRSRLEAFRRKNAKAVVGVNIGKNKETEDAAADYAAGVQSFEDLASYLVVNISSPNTPGLRALQRRDELSALLDRTLKARKGKTPVLVKVAPDLTEEECADIAAVALLSGIDGLVVSNTTLSRPDFLPAGFAAEKGGLSGEPLFIHSTEVVRTFYNLTNGKLPIIGVGGVSSAEDALSKLSAGAALVQLYSALVFQGPGLVAEVIKGMSRGLAASGQSAGKSLI